MNKRKKKKIGGLVHATRSDGPHRQVKAVLVELVPVTYDFGSLEVEGIRLGINMKTVYTHISMKK